jgi:DNA excision repair protein ERCC-3
MIVDEVHHLPAPTYSRLAFIHSDYRLGLSATPWREDGHSEYIYGLCGFPHGSAWDRLVNEGWIRKPPVYVHITPYKISTAYKLAETLKPKLIIYSDTISLGEDLSRRLKIPFVHGKHTMKKRLEILKEHDRIVASRIFDEGMDIPQLRSVIEVDYLGGSRRQEAQRAFRLCHSAYEGIEHHLLMTPEEYEAYGKRLWGVYQRGLEIKFINV